MPDHAAVSAPLAEARLRVAALKATIRNAHAADAPLSATAILGELDRVAQRLEQAHRDHAQLCQDRDARAAELAGAHQRIDELTAAAADAHAQAQRLMTGANESRAALASARARIEALEAERGTLAAELAGARRDVDDATAAVQQAQVNRAELAELRAQVRFQESLLENLKAAAEPPVEVSAAMAQAPSTDDPGSELSCPEDDDDGGDDGDDGDDDDSDSNTASCRPLKRSASDTEPEARQCANLPAKRLRADGSANGNANGSAAHASGSTAPRTSAAPYAHVSPRAETQAVRGYRVLASVPAPRTTDPEKVEHYSKLLSVIPISRGMSDRFRSMLATALLNANMPITSTSSWHGTTLGSSSVANFLLAQFGHGGYVVEKPALDVPETVMDELRKQGGTDPLAQIVRILRVDRDVSLAPYLYSVHESWALVVRSED